MKKMSHLLPEEHLNRIAQYVENETIFKNTTYRIILASSECIEEKTINHVDEIVKVLEHFEIATLNRQNGKHGLKEMRFVDSCVNNIGLNNQNLLLYNKREIIDYPRICNPKYPMLFYDVLDNNNEWHSAYAMIVPENKPDTYTPYLTMLFMFNYLSFYKDMERYDMKIINLNDLAYYATQHVLGVKEFSFKYYCGLDILLTHYADIILKPAYLVGAFTGNEDDFEYDLQVAHGLCRGFRYAVTREWHLVNDH